MHGLSTSISSTASLTPQRTNTHQGLCRRHQRQRHQAQCHRHQHPLGGEAQHHRRSPHHRHQGHQVWGAAAGVDVALALTAVTPVGARRAGAIARAVAVGCGALLPPRLLWARCGDTHRSEVTPKMRRCCRASRGTRARRRSSGTWCSAQSKVAVMSFRSNLWAVDVQHPPASVCATLSFSRPAGFV